MTLTGHDAYVRYELFWAAPVIALQWLVAARELWRWRRLLFAVILLSTLYLSVCDAFALESGIWRVDPSRVVGIYVRHLPLEEFIFYFVTSIMAAQAFVMLTGFLRERKEKNGQQNTGRNGGADRGDGA